YIGLQQPPEGGVVSPPTVYDSLLLSRRLLSTITEPLEPTCEASGAPLSSLVTDDGDSDRGDLGGIKKVCFKVSEEDQEDSGHDTVSYRDSYSECNSNRDSVLSYTSVRSNSSYLGSDEMGS
ncbi:hypothetical protein GDO78_022316, partial [Eleutherodactylus coqui]